MFLTKEGEKKYFLFDFQNEFAKFFLCKMLFFFQFCKIYMFINKKKSNKVTILTISNKPPKSYPKKIVFLDSIKPEIYRLQLNFQNGSSINFSSTPRTPFDLSPILIVVTL